MSITEKMNAERPKKILSLDGGGIRGMMTVEVLAKLEQLLREQQGPQQDDQIGSRPLVLSDYFDYISGTSTGAIIATALSLGWEVSKLRDFYLTSGESMFDSAGWLKRFRYMYDDDNLSDKLKDEIGKDTLLGSEKLQTLLMVVLRNATTDSPWPLSNNPHAKYNNRARPDCNLDLPLWKLVRASSAAPVYFPPEAVKLGEQKFIFVDGGITTYNNPTFQTFLMATLPEYKLNWPTGADKMLVVSIGTGSSADANKSLKAGKMNVLYNAKSLPSALMFAAQNEQDTLCRSFGRCLHGGKIDREIGAMVEDGDRGNRNLPELFTYVRYNAQLDKQGLAALGLPDIKPKKVQKLDSFKNVADLQRIGKAVADRQVKLSHFDGFL